MFSRHAISIVIGLALCLIVTTASAERLSGPDLIAEDEIAVTKAQQELDLALWQVEVNRESDFSELRNSQDDVTEAMKKLHKAQLKLKIDQNRLNGLR